MHDAGEQVEVWIPGRRSREGLGVVVEATNVGRDAANLSTIEEALWEGRNSYINGNGSEVVT